MARVFNHRILLIIIAVLLISNISMLAFWYSMKNDHKTRGEMGRSPMSSFLETKVGFNTQQMAGFEKLRSEHRQKLKPMFEDLREAKNHFYHLLTQPSVPDSQVQTEAAKIGIKQRDLDVRAFQNFKELRSLCTDKQRPVYDSLIPGIISDMWFPSRRGGMQKQNTDSSRRSRP